MENILPIVIADAPGALSVLCGVNLLERSLRILQRLGFRRAIVFSSTPEIVGTELAKRSWAREQMTVQLVSSVTETSYRPTAFGAKLVGTLFNRARKHLL